MRLTVIFLRLRNIPRLYRIYFARYFFFRLLKEMFLVTYKVMNRVHCFINPACCVCEYDLVSAKDFQVLGEGRSRVLVEASRNIKISAPQFVKRGCAPPKCADEIQFDTPQLEVVALSGVIAVGGTNFIFVDDCVIYPDLFDPLHDTCPAETFGVASINSAKGKVKLHLSKKQMKVDRAVCLLSQSANNYAHFLTEVLPKLQIIEGCPEYVEWPLLIEGWIHPTLVNAVVLLNKNEREIIRVSRWESVSLNRMINISLPGYEPYVPHKLFMDESELYVNRFSPVALDMLRKRAREIISSQSGEGIKKVYLRRSENSNLARSVINARELEELLRQYGFEIIEPGSLSFMDQIKACSDAEVIVAPVGASLANMIFAKPGCKIIALAPYFSDGNYYYYSNLAGVLGHELCYYLGVPKEGGGHPRHRDYAVDLGGLQEELEKYYA